MLTIRKEQDHIFADLRRRQFIEEMEARLRADFPGALAGYEEEELRERIGRALGRAEEFGITRRGDAARYLQICVAAGWEFADDPEWGMVREALAGDGETDAGVRVGAACALTERELARREELGRLLEGKAGLGAAAGGGAA